MQTALTISQIVRLPLLLIIFLSFETVALPVPVTGMPDSAASFTYSVPVRNVFLHLFNFKWSLKIPYQSHNPPPPPKSEPMSNGNLSVKVQAQLLIHIYKSISQNIKQF